MLCEVRLIKPLIPTSLLPDLKKKAIFLRLYKTHPYVTPYEFLILNAFSQESTVAVGVTQRPHKPLVRLESRAMARVRSSQWESIT